MKITIESAFEIGDVVFLRMRQDHVGGIITRLMVFGAGEVSYSVSWGNGQDSWHYAMELSTEYVPNFVS